MRGDRLACADVALLAQVNEPVLRAESAGSLLQHALAMTDVLMRLRERMGEQEAAMRSLQAENEQLRSENEALRGQG